MNTGTQSKRATILEMELANTIRDASEILLNAVGTMQTQKRAQDKGMKERKKIVMQKLQRDTKAEKRTFAKTLSLSQRLVIV